MTCGDLPCSSVRKRKSCCCGCEVQMESRPAIVAECLEVRARLRVRRCMLGEAAVVTGVRGGLVEMVGVGREGVGRRGGSAKGMCRIEDQEPEGRAISGRGR